MFAITELGQRSQKEPLIDHLIEESSKKEEILSKVVYGFPERTLFSKLTYATSSAVFISSPSLNRTPLITFSIS